MPIASNTRCNTILSNDINNFERMMLVNDRDSDIEAELKQLSSDIQHKPLQKCIKQHKLMRKFKYKLISSTAGPDNKAIKHVYLVRQYDFKDSRAISSHDPIPHYARTRRVSVEMITYNHIPYVVVNCDCDYICRESHLCRHAQCILADKPSIDFFHPECYKSYFHFMYENHEYTKMVNEYDAIFELKKGIIFKSEKFNK